MARIGMLPLWAVSIILFVVTGGLWYLFGVVTKPDTPVDVRLVGTVFFAGVMTTVFTISIRRTRRLAGGAEPLQRMRVPLRRGEVPADADVSTWAAVLDARRRTLRRLRWSGPIVFGVALVLSLWWATTQSAYWWLAVAFCIAVLAFTVITTPRALQDTVRMQEDLSRRRASDEP